MTEEEGWSCGGGGGSYNEGRGCSPFRLASVWGEGPPFHARHQAPAPASLTAPRKASQ